MLTITQLDGKWVVLRDGSVLAVKDRHEDAVAMLAVGDGDDLSLLPERWAGPIARSKLTGDGRDFTATKWTWRDPEASRLPLMWQTQTDMGHFSAQLAGYMTELRLDDDGTVWAEGAFFDSDEGRAFRDVLRGAGRWGVSVDPGAVEWEESCLEEDDEGWCVKGLTTFLAYEVIGVTGTPFPAFADAWIELTSTEVADEATPAPADAAAARLAALAIEDMPPHPFTDANGDGECDFCADTDDDGNCTSTCGADAAAHAIFDTDDDSDDADETASIAASGAPARPPLAWFDNPELSEPTALTITDDGRVFCHVATFDQCHVGWSGTCITAPDKVAMRLFHTGSVLTAEGAAVPTGPLVMGTDHPALDLDGAAALDHYAHTGCAWADVRLGVDDIGIWCAGAVRPGFDDDQLRVLRASALSGDWRQIDGELQLCAVLTVNTPGFPIPRALAASAKPRPHELDRMRARLVSGNVLAATGVGLVRCAECAKRATNSASAAPDDRIEKVLQLMQVLELRTRALASTRREQLARRLRRAEQ